MDGPKHVDPSGIAQLPTGRPGRSAEVSGTYQTSFPIRTIGRTFVSTLGDVLCIQVRLRTSSCASCGEAIHSATDSPSRPNLKVVTCIWNRDPEVQAFPPILACLPIRQTRGNLPCEGVRTEACGLVCGFEMIVGGSITEALRRIPSWDQRATTLASSRKYSNACRKVPCSSQSGANFGWPHLPSNHASSITGARFTHLRSSTLYFPRLSTQEASQ